MEFHYLSHDAFSRLFAELVDLGYEVIAPQVRESAIVFDPLSSLDAIARGWQVVQAPGSYRLQQGETTRWFAWANGPQALKPLVFPPREDLWQSWRDESGLHFHAAQIETPPRAVIGVRACDLAALALMDQHFLRSDSHYQQRRNSLFLIAVDCAQPAATCFCASTGDGPHVQTSVDIALSELDDGFIARAGSVGGRAILDALDLPLATPSQLAQREAQNRHAQNQSRQLPATNLRNSLFAAAQHPHWNNVAQRCLSCGNCTSVCPTCFCHAERETPDLSGEQSRHTREWDSCFSSGHSYIHGITIRSETTFRYRQWLTHKLAGWHDQFGRSGCVGCGRCIAWCPVGIDITQEVEALYATP